MLEKGRISGRQFTILVMLYLIGSAILIIPSILASEAKQDAWIAALLTVGVALFIMPLYVALGSRFPNMTFAEYTEEILGKWLGKTVTLLFLIAFPFFTASLTLRNIGDFVTTQIMPETPIQAIHIIFLGIIIMGVRLGLEPLARAAELFFPGVILLFLLLIAFTAPQMKLENIQPVLEEGIKPVLRAAVPFISFPFVEPVIFLMLFPYVNRTKQTGKALFTGILLGGIFLFVVTALTILVIGVDQATRQNFPSYVLTKEIRVGQFLERIEAIMAVIWFITIFFRMCIFLYVVALGIAQALNLKDYRFLTFPLGMILTVLSIVGIPSSTYLLEFNQKIWPIYAATFGLFLPLLLLGTAIFRKKRKRNN